MNLTFETHFVHIADERVHIQRIFKSPGKPVLFIHGSIENGKVFYTRSGKGLASYLANQGYDCFVADLPGRGGSTPAITKHSKHDLVFYIEEVIPTLLSTARQHSGVQSVAVVAHSWGGVITLASIALKNLQDISHLIFFGSKRRISIQSIKKFFMVDVVWRSAGKVLASAYKYYPAKEYRFGSDNETTESFLQTDQWVKDKQWRHFTNQVDIAAKLKEISLPPLLALTGSKDDVLGHPTDVEILVRETGEHQVNKLMTVGRATGFKKDYGHIDLLTSPVAVDEVFPHALNWLRSPHPSPKL
jgi:pimeloyl-ACP methyl ester carboxylesterase